MIIFNVRRYGDDFGDYVEADSFLHAALNYAKMEGLDKDHCLENSVKLQVSDPVKTKVYIVERKTYLEGIEEGNI